MVAAAQEPTLLQRRDQPVDAGLGPEVQRLLHLVEARRIARGLEMTVDEYQQLVLLARQHDQPLLGTSLPIPASATGTNRDHRVIEIITKS